MDFTDADPFTTPDNGREVVRFVDIIHDHRQVRLAMEQHAPDFAESFWCDQDGVISIDEA